MSVRNASKVTGGDLSARTSYLPVICLALIFFIASWNTRERPLVLIAMPILLLIFVRDLRTPTPRPGFMPIIVAGLMLLGYDMLSPRALGQGQPDGQMINTYARVMNVIWTFFALGLIHRVRRGVEVGWKWRMSAVALAAILSAGLIIATPAPGIDVWHLQQQAGEALFDGKNPYADINVPFSAEDSDRDSQQMTGYPYTPINLIVFGSSAAFTGDARWLSLTCWLGFLILFGSARSQSNAGTALLFFLASQPAWHVVLEISYTETVTLLLLMGAVLAWKSRKTLGPAMLGLALSSKQYLVVLAPMVLGAWLLDLRARLTSLLIAGLAAGVGLLWGPDVYLDSIVGFHLKVPPQTHSVNLLGASDFLGAPVVLPAIVGIAASVAIGLISARKAHTTSQLLIGSATALGLGFFLATQAFVNYWFLVGCILALALLLAEPRENTSDSTKLDKNDPSAVVA